jgi:hypothetical protein
MRDTKHLPARRLLAALLLAAALLAVPAGAYTDLGEHWSAQAVETLSAAGLINGFPDGSFRPDDTLRRGEYIKMLCLAAELEPVGNGSVHWAAPYWTALQALGLIDAAAIPCTPAALDQEITRYEMASLTSAVVFGCLGESLVMVLDPAALIPDYGQVPDSLQDAVTQVYAKGIITGYEDGSFQGSRTLTRGEAATVVWRVLDESQRRPPDLGETEPDPPEENRVSFAVRYQSMSTTERRTTLFGDPNKTYFANAEEGGPYMTEVTVPVWRLNESTGEKTAGQLTLTVHREVAWEVEQIFETIFNDPERFPIKSAGGTRYGDTMRHAWGCAIDINYNENAYGRYDGEGNFVCSTGSGWWPGENPWSITPTGSVVRAFAKYGWGWGGQGYSGGTYDYMHFSILPSGG